MRDYKLSVLFFLMFQPFLVTGCSFPSMSGYDIAVDFLKKWKKVREMPSRFTCVNSYAIKEISHFGHCAIPILVADVLLSGDHEKEWTALEIQFREMAEVEYLLNTWERPAYFALMSGKTPDMEMILGGVRRLYKKFGLLLGMQSISSREREHIRRLVKDLEDEELILADEICIGGHLVSGLVFGWHLVISGRGIEEEAAKWGKSLHPLVLLDGKALPFLLEEIKKKEHPVKEICIANGILRRWGAIETIFFSVTEWLELNDLPMWLIEHEKKWFCELYDAFERIKEAIRLGKEPWLRTAK